MYNAFESLQAFELGTGQRKERERETAMKGIGNAFASGDYTGAANQAFVIGDLSTGMDISKYGKSLEDAEAEKKRVASIRYGMQLLNEKPEAREMKRSQIVTDMRALGYDIDDNYAAQMDLSDKGIQDTLALLQDTDSLMAQYQGMMNPEYMAAIEGNDAQGNPIYYQPSKTGPGRTLDGITPIQAPADYGSAADALGVRRYTEGPKIGQPVPGFETPRPNRGGMEFSVDENGNPVVRFGGPGQGSAFGSAGDRAGATAFGTAVDEAGTADATTALANQARAIIEGGFNSGALANLKGQAGRYLNEFGLGDPEKTADYEQFTAVNNQLAAQMLKLFGGSDTERELAISMASNIGPSFGEATNKRMLDALDQAINIQRRKPEFIAQWIQKNGSLDAIDRETQLGYQATWDRFLQSQFTNLRGSANDTNQAALEEAAGGLSPDKMTRLQELRAKRDRGELQ